MSESNIKTEIRTDERMFNRLAKETVTVFYNSTEADQSASSIISDITSLAATRRDAPGDADFDGKSLRNGIIEVLYLIQNVRKIAVDQGFNAWKGSNTIGTLFQDVNEHLCKYWHKSFLAGFEGHKFHTAIDGSGNFTGSAVDAASIDWELTTGVGQFEDQIRYWGYVKGCVYSDIHDQIKATEKITSDSRDDYTIISRMLSIDALEEWINEYIDAIAQTGKAVLNIGAAKLVNLGRSDLKELFNDDVSVPRPLLELARSSSSDTFTSLNVVLPEFNFDDMITRSNVSTLYNTYTRKYPRPSTSLSNAQKYFGMGTYEDSLGVVNHFLNGFFFCDEDGINERKAGYSLNIYLSILDYFYGDDEYNIAVNRERFLRAGTHWSVKEHAKLFDKQFYTYTSLSTIKGLADSSIYPAAMMAFGERLNNPSVAAAGGANYISTSNMRLRGDSDIEIALQRNSEDYVSSIRIPLNMVHNYNVSDFSNWLHLRGMLISGSIGTDTVSADFIKGAVRYTGKEFRNVVIPAFSSSIDSPSERERYQLWVNSLDSSDFSEYGLIPSPELLNITDLSGLYVSGGSDQLMYYSANYHLSLKDESLYILNIYNKDVRNSMYKMGLATTSKGTSAVQASEAIVNDNDNDNDGDDSS